MNILGISTVRNEADIIRLTILHHLSIGFDGLLVVDNGSTDGTDKELDLFRGDERVRWTRNESPWHQAELFTDLAREAFNIGADWIVPFAADEFFYARSLNFRQVLAEAEAEALMVPAINFIQVRDQHRASRKTLLTMTCRAPHQVGPPERCKELVEAGEIALVEIKFPPRWVCRATSDISFSEGCHHIFGLDGPFRYCSELAILHAPLRSRDTLDKKADHGRRHDEAGSPRGMGWHSRRLARLQAEGALEQEWAANSYSGGFLDVYGSKRPVIWDPTLRNIVAPIIRSSLAETPSNTHKS